MLAAEWYRKAAEYGDPLGQAALGVATFQGVGVPKNAVEGYIWTKLAAKHGNPKARSNLPAMVREMTDKELKRARYKVSRFRAKGTRRKPHRPYVRYEIYDTRGSARGHYQSGRSRGERSVLTRSKERARSMLWASTIRADGHRPRQSSPRRALS